MSSVQQIKLSVLDQSPITAGSSPRQAIQESEALVRLTDRLGYTRYWVSEHHNITALAGSTPEVLIAHLAGESTRIRVGSGGIMLPNHSALKVAENFRMLETLFPGRIDLGMGRAPGGDRLTAAMLNPSNRFDEREFIQQLIDLRAFLSDEHEKVKAIPQAPTLPELWLLTSSGESALAAAHFGMGLSFARFINPQGDVDAIRNYKERFRPSAELREPAASIGLFVCCADTEEKAAELQAVLDHRLLHIERSAPRYGDIREVAYTDAEQERIRYNRGRMVTGTAGPVKKQLETIAAAAGVGELVVTTITEHFEDRLRSYELLAAAFGL
jgi:luciferase family oxidoreductase group 1